MLPPLIRDPETFASLEPGAFLWRRGDPCEQVWWLHSGRVALGLAHPRDHGALAQRLGSAEGPHWIEAGQAVLGLPPLVDAVAETALKVARVPLPVFRRWLDTVPRPLKPVLHDIALGQRSQMELAVSRLSKDAHGRLAEWLLRQAAPSGGEASLLLVRLQEHKRQIAAQLGIAPETLSRVLRDFKDRRYIAGTGRVMTLIDAEGLRGLANV